MVLGLVVVLIAAGAGGYAWYLNHLVHRITVKGLAAGETHGTESGTENILLVGSTDRCALKKQYIGYGICSQGVNGINSDVVMILHLNPTTHSVSILSIPRDLFVPNARIEGANKIDAALYQGPTQLVAAIQEDFAIPIQHYVELNFDSFASVVNALGGINMYFPEPVYDAESDLDVTTVGCHHLNGFHALQVVRARHMVHKGPGVTSNDPANWTPEAQSDLARIRRDHEFLRVLATAVAKKGLSDPLTDRSIITGVAPDLTVDSGFSAGHMINLVLTYHSVNVDEAPQLTVPVLEDTFGSYQYDGGNYGDIEFPDSAGRSVRGRLIPRHHLEHQLDDGRATARPGEDHRVGGQRNGRDGSGRDHLGRPRRARLPHGRTRRHVAGRTGSRDRRLLRLEVTGGTGGGAGGGQLHFGIGHPRLQPVHGARRRRGHGGHRNQLLGESPQGGNDHATKPSKPSKASKGTTTTTTTAPPSTTTTTTTPNGFNPPTSADEALEPWDPRSCTASGGEGP